MKFALVSETATAYMMTAMRADRVAPIRSTALRAHLESSSHALRRTSRLNGMRMMAELVVVVVEEVSRNGGGMVEDEGRDEWAGSTGVALLVNVAVKSSVV